jgi:hypothetical protein
MLEKLECPKCHLTARHNGVVKREGRIKERFICPNRHTFYAKKERDNMLRKEQRVMRRAIRAAYVYEHFDELTVEQLAPSV